MAARVEVRISFPSFSSDTEQFFFCRKCKTHIVKTKDLRTHSAEGVELRDPFFINVINVHILNPSVTEHIRGSEVISVQCRKCDYVLGKQRLITPEKAVNPKVMLDLKKLMKWDGQKIVDGADSAEYGMMCKNYPADFTIEPWFADSPAGHVGLEVCILSHRSDPKTDQFFVCRECQTEIAKAEDFHIENQGTQLQRPVFRNIINVHTANAVKQQTGDFIITIVKDFNCNKCGNFLGKYHFEIPRAVGTPVVSAYTPDLKKLLKWNGQNYVDGTDT